MAYTRTNYRTKKEFREAVLSGERVEAFQPGPFGPTLRDGTHCFEGPHYPEAHKWYATAEVKDGVVIKVKQ